MSTNARSPSIRSGLLFAFAILLVGFFSGWISANILTDRRWQKSAVEHDAGIMVKNHSGGDVFLFWEEVEDAKYRGVKIRNVN